MSDDPRLDRDRFVLYPWAWPGTGDARRQGRQMSDRATTADNPTLDDGTTQADLTEVEDDE